MLSLITPPDCLATYAAAAIAKADFWRTGWAGMRLGVVAYVVPFVFVYHPALILHGSTGKIVARSSRRRSALSSSASDAPGTSTGRSRGGSGRGPGWRQDSS